MEAGEKRVPPKRFAYIIALFLVSLAAVIFMIYGRRVLLDEIIGIIALFLAFSMVFIIALIQLRRMGRLSYDGTTYKRVFILSSLCWGIIVLSSYMPVFLAPVILTSFILVSAVDGLLSLSAALFMDMMLCYTCGMSSNTLYCYLMLSIFGALIAVFLKDRRDEKSPHLYMLLLIVQFSFPVIYYEFSYGRLSVSFLISAALSAIIITIVVMLSYKWLLRIDEAEESISYEMYLEDDFSLAIELMRFSGREYAHGKKVSELSMACAREVGKNAQLAGVAGLYYRVGCMRGEPLINHNVEIASEYCLPAAVKQILSEYQGIVEKPSTIESAIVQMVDSLVSRIDAIGDETMESSWNQEMLIYQTLTELSNKGMYDDCGLTMNQFLRIRDCLILKENLI